MASKKTHSFKEWLIATRPWSFPASAMPILVTCAYLFWKGENVDWLIGLLTLVNVVVFHASGNCWSDYKDFVSGVDREDTIGGLSITSGEFAPKEIKRLALSLLVVAVLLSAVLIYLKGITVLWFVAAGALLTLLYPWLKYHALGDVDIFLTYSLLPIFGTSYVVTGELNPAVLWLTLPIGLITVGILHANNIRDIEHDKRAGIHTLAMLLGKKVSVFLYCTYMLLPFIWVIVTAILGIFPMWSLFVLVALKPALDNIAKAVRYPREGMAAMNGVDEKTAQLQLAFSLILTLSLVIPALV